MHPSLEKVLEKINQWRNSPNNYWSDDAEKWFREKYDGEKEVEGPLNNELDAFRHAYGSALMSYYVGKFISGLIFDGHELGAANVPLEHRMDVWNNEVGRMIYDQIKSSLDPTKTKESLFLGQIADIPISKDLDKVKEKIAEAVIQALERGVLAKNLEDERLKKLFPDDPKLEKDQKGVGCEDLAKITKDARDLLEKEKNTLDPDGTGEGGGGSDSGENGGGGNENANNGGEGSGNGTGQDGGNVNGVSDSDGSGFGGDGDGSADGRGDGGSGGGFGGGDGAPTPRDPLLLDLNRNGKIDISRRAHFDFDKNGFKELSHWMSDGDGVLVMDRNGDGVVNDGTELFGDRTPLPDGTTARTGFEALATLDENGDGIVDASDGMFSSLKVWVDTNGDGISTSDELRSLEETGIKSIRLESAENGAVDEHNNVAARNGTFEWVDGTTGAVGEMLLQGDTMHSVPTELLELSEEIASMPELLGGGTLHDLRQAMARDESGKLKGLVESFAAAKDMESRRAILKELVFAWTGADSVDPGSRGGLVDARELAVLERYAGRDFVGSNGPNPHANAAPLLKQAYAGLMEHFYRNLVKQTHYDGYFRSMKESNTLGALEYLLSNMLSPEIGQEESVSRLRELLSLMKGGKISQASSAKQMHELISLLTVAGWGDASPELANLLRHEVIEERGLLSFSKDRNLVGGSNGDDEVSGSQGNDVLRGAFGNDKLYGQDGDDILVGGAGDDHLVGGYGSDTYVYNKGDGHDTIDNSTYYYDTTPGRQDRLQFGEGISAEDIEVIRRGNNDVTFSLGGGSGSVLVKNWYSGSQYSLDEVEFADGTKWSVEDVASRAVTYGTDEGEELGNNGNFSGNDKIHAGAGDDKLYGYNGDDVLVGGAGDDYLEGGYGSDTYVYNKGDGHDTIDQYTYFVDEGTDRLEFGEGITSEDIEVIRRGNDVTFSLKDGTGSVLMQNWYVGGSYKKLDEVEFADGTVWGQEDVEFVSKNEQGCRPGIYSANLVPVDYY